MTNEEERMLRITTNCYGCPNHTNADWFLDGTTRRCRAVKIQRRISHLTETFRPIHDCFIPCWCPLEPIPHHSDAEYDELNESLAVSRRLNVELKAQLNELGVKQRCDRCDKLWDYDAMEWNCPACVADYLNAEIRELKAKLDGIIKVAELRGAELERLKKQGKDGEE